MFTELLSQPVQTFIREHERDDVRQLLLQSKTVHGIPMSVIADQINGRKKASEKLPLYYRTPGILYPPGLNLEQSSSESTAGFKVTHALDSIPDHTNCVDLTGGFGVDTYFLSKLFRQVQYVEPDKSLLEIVKHNHGQLGGSEIEYINTTAQEFLASTNRRFSCLYIDPSRRNKAQRKVFSFSDCEPDVTALLATIFEKTDALLIKSSPLLDIQHSLRELGITQKVFVVSVENECKEVLYLLLRDFSGEPTVHAINILKNNGVVSFVFKLPEEHSAAVSFSDPLHYLYEPNASILKAGAFKLVGLRYGIKKLHVNTHLYTSAELQLNFPGRAFRIIAAIKPQAKSLREFFPEGKANITTRNYPASVQELKKMTGLNDGGTRFLIGFSGQQKKFLVVAERVY